MKSADVEVTRKPRPYIDRGRPGTLRYQRGHLPQVAEPPAAPHVILKLQALRRHNTLQPELQPTHRIFLRWVETGAGTGLPNPDAERRELHFDPLPPDEEERVTAIVRESPWEHLIKKWYLSTLDSQRLADALCISRTQLYADWRSALWYFRGRLEADGFDVRGSSTHGA